MKHLLGILIVIVALGAASPAAAWKCRYRTNEVDLETGERMLVMRPLSYWNIGDFEFMQTGDRRELRYTARLVPGIDVRSEMKITFALRDGSTLSTRPAEVVLRQQAAVGSATYAVEEEVVSMVLDLGDHDWERLAHPGPQRVQIVVAGKARTIELPDDDDVLEFATRIHCLGDPDEPGTKPRKREPIW